MISDEWTKETKHTKIVSSVHVTHTNNDNDDVLHDEDIESKFPFVVSYLIHAFTISHLLHVVVVVVA